MKGDRLVIRELNKNLGLLLVTINQYFLHARILKNWGFEELGEHFFKQSIREMKSADDLIDRDLLEKQKDINEEHIDWLETQQELIGKIGLPNYLQTAAQED